MDPLNQELPPEELETETIPEETQETQFLIDPEVARAIITCYEYYRNEGSEQRDKYIAFWKKFENYWEGIQNIFFDAAARDWRRFDVADDLDPNLYDRIINIYKAHGESLIAALSIRLPHVTFYPDDADTPEDIDTAKAYAKIATLIEKHNQGVVLFMKALFYIYNQGLAAAYIYNRASGEYGSLQVPAYGPDVRVITSTADCPYCGLNLGQEEFKDQEPIQPGLLQCPSCGPVIPNYSTTEEILPQVIGYTNEPKSRTIIDIFGPMHAQTALYARKPEHTPYVHLRFEQHENLLKDHYKDFFDSIAGNPNTEDFDRQARAKDYLNFDSDRHLVTVTCQWLRPWAYNCLPEDQRKLLKSKFPSGCYAVILDGDLVVDVADEDLDEHWEFTQNPLSNFLHADPLGKVLAPVQDLRNEGTDLSIETFEHSIPETFVDPEVLDLDEYKKEEARPGMVYPTKPLGGKRIGDSFHSLKTATLNEEIDGFIKRLDVDGQFVSGSFPSIYGGPATSGSKTAREYSESRAMALQRLNITWTYLKQWWARVIGRAVVHYANGMVEDEKVVQKESNDIGFVNIWIKQAELQGSVGAVEAEADEELPVSASQIKAILVDLMTLQSGEINSALYHPNNFGLLSRAMGITDFYFPGQNERDKQLSEISELLKAAPLPDGMPTIAPDMDLDKHMIEAETIMSWASSPTGQRVKKMNPAGYANVVAHLKLHRMALSMLQPQEASSEAEPNKPAEETEDAA